MPASATSGPLPDSRRADVLHFDLACDHLVAEPHNFGATV